MLQHAVPKEGHRIAGNLLSIDDQIVTPGKFRRNAQRLQRIHNRLQIPQEVNFLLSRFHILDEGEVEISNVVEDRTAARQPPNHVNMVTVNVFLVDFRRRILVLSHHDGVVILPQHKDIVGRLLQQILLRRQVVVRGGAVDGDVSDFFHYPLKLSPASSVSGRKSITLRISPAMQKPHWLHTPALLPTHSGRRVPSGRM